MAKISMTVADLTKWVAFGGVKVKEIWGWNPNAADVYIQLHEVPPLAAGGLTAGAVPACKSLLAQGATNSGYAAGNGFKYEFDGEGILLNELLVALSSTEANYTAVGAGAGLDMTLVVDSVYLCNGTEVVVGDLTTNQQTLQVWSQAAGALQKYRLLRLDVKENAGTASTLDVYATDNFSGVSNSHIKLTVNSTNAIGFGIDGLSPFKQTATYDQYFGCSVQITGSANTNIRAIYR